MTVGTYVTERCGRFRRRQPWRLCSRSHPTLPFACAGRDNPGKLALDQPPHDGLGELFHLRLRHHHHLLGELLRLRLRCPHRWRGLGLGPPPPWRTAAAPWSSGIERCDAAGGGWWGEEEVATRGGRRAAARTRWLGRRRGSRNRSAEAAAGWKKRGRGGRDIFTFPWSRFSPMF